MFDKLSKNQSCLSPEAYRVLREHGTERPFSSPLNDEKRSGTFYCADCGQALYTSKTKYESGSGWPSFWDTLPGATLQRRDISHGMIRDEVVCAKCEGHLGHVFEDGPPPTGLRYCMNGVALRFEPD
jgi:peptide-methionine (R)-S-oxide reductase